MEWMVISDSVWGLGKGTTPFPSSESTPFLPLWLGRIVHIISAPKTYLFFFLVMELLLIGTSLATELAVPCLNNFHRIRPTGGLDCY